MPIVRKLGCLVLRVGVWRRALSRLSRWPTGRIAKFLVVCIILGPPFVLVGTTICAKFSCVVLETCPVRFGIICRLLERAILLTVIALAYRGALRCVDVTVKYIVRLSFGLSIPVFLIAVVHMLWPSNRNPLVPLAMAISTAAWPSLSLAVVCWGVGVLAIEMSFRTLVSKGCCFLTAMAR